MDVLVQNEEAERLRKVILLTVAALVLMIMAIPALLVSFASTPSQTEVQVVEKGQIKHENPVPSSFQVKVYLTKEKKILTLPVEQYVIGVVAAEMPANFHPEALKAQALAARTYLAERIQKNAFQDMKRWGQLAEGAHVTDTVFHQAFLPDEQLKKAWGAKYTMYHQRIKDAVQATEGQVITYQGKPIYAAFFSTSNGHTENSEDYFSKAYPYLKKVSSPWDRESPKYYTKTNVKLKTVIQQLEKASGKPIAMATSTNSSLVTILERTEGQRVKRVRIGDKIFTGRFVREALGLPSADFQLKINGDHVIIETRGYGHGVGMSQWGAHEMAKLGKTAAQIIQHYYQGVRIQQWNW